MTRPTRMFGAAFRSDPQMPQASTRNTRSEGPGVGSGYSTMSKVFFSFSTAARIAHLSQFDHRTTIDVENGAGDERRFVGSEEQRRVRDVVDMTMTFDELCLFVMVPEDAVVAQPRPELVGEDAARSDRIDAYVVLAAAAGEVDDEPFHRGLRGLIRRRGCAAHLGQLIAPDAHPRGERSDRNRGTG